MCDDKDKHDPVIFNLGDRETISSSDLNSGVISESGITIGINSTQLDFMASLSILKSRNPNKNYSYKLEDINFSDLGSGKLMGDPKVSTNWEEVAKEAKESDLYAVYNAAHYRLSEVFIKNRVFTHVPNPDKEPENKEIIVEFTGIQTTGPEVSELAKKMLRRLGPPPLIKDDNDKV